MTLVRFLIFQENFGGASENIRKNSRQRPLQLSVLLVFLLVPRSKRSRRISLFPNEGIEQMARKNDGAWRQPQADQDRRRLPRRPPEIQRGCVELRQNFRRDKRLSLSLCHAGRERARRRSLQALAVRVVAGKCERPLSARSGRSIPDRTKQQLGKEDLREAGDAGGPPRTRRQVEMRQACLPVG